jgi:tetratricopeptide (TPR) repeat protein
MITSNRRTHRSKVKPTAARLAQVLSLSALCSMSHANDDLAEALALYHAESYSEAAARFQPLAASNPENRDINFWLAHAVAKSGDFAAAKPLFDALRAAYPNDLRIQLEYAEVLAGLGDKGGARRAYNAVLESDPPASVAGNIRSRLAKLEPRSKRGFFASLQLGAQADDNIYSGPDIAMTDAGSGIITLLGKEAGVSSTNTIAAGQATWVMPLGGSERWIHGVGAQGYGSWNGEDDAVNYQMVRGEWFAQYNNEALRLRLPFSVSTSWYGDESLSDMYDFRPELGYRVSDRVEIGVNVGVASDGYKNPQFALNDGDVLKAQAFVNFTLGERGQLRLSAGTESRDADSPVFSHDGPVYQGALNLRFTDVISFTGTLQYQELDFDGVTPLLGQVRSDERLAATAGLSFNVFDAAKIELNHTFIDAQSNVFLYDYERNMTSLLLRYSW